MEFWKWTEMIVLLEFFHLYFQERTMFGGLRDLCAVRLSAWAVMWIPTLHFLMMDHSKSIKGIWIRLKMDHAKLLYFMARWFSGDIPLLVSWHLHPLIGIAFTCMIYLHVHVPCSWALVCLDPVIKQTEEKCFCFKLSMWPIRMQIAKTTIWPQFM